MDKSRLGDVNLHQAKTGGYFPCRHDDLDLQTPSVEKLARLWYLGGMIKATSGSDYSRYLIAEEDHPEFKDHGIEILIDTVMTRLEFGPTSTEYQLIQELVLTEEGNAGRIKIIKNFKEDKYVVKEDIKWTSYPHDSVEGEEWGLALMCSWRSTGGERIRRGEAEKEKERDQTQNTGAETLPEGSHQDSSGSGADYLEANNTSLIDPMSVLEDTEHLRGGDNIAMDRPKYGSREIQSAMNCFKIGVGSGIMEALDGSIPQESLEEFDYNVPSVDQLMAEIQVSANQITEDSKKLAYLVAIRKVMQSNENKLRQEAMRIRQEELLKMNIFKDAFHDVLASTVDDPSSAARIMFTDYVAWKYWVKHRSDALRMLDPQNCVTPDHFITQVNDIMADVLIDTGNVTSKEFNKDPVPLSKRELIAEIRSAASVDGSVKRQLDQIINQCKSMADWKTSGAGSALGHAMRDRRVSETQPVDSDPITASTPEPPRTSAEDSSSYEALVARMRAMRQ